MQGPQKKSHKEWRAAAQGANVQTSFQDPTKANGLYGERELAREPIRFVSISYADIPWPGT